MSTWNAPRARIADALRRLADARADVERSSAAPAAVLALLEAFGRALACAANVDPPELGPDAAARVRAALSSDAFDLAVLEDEGVRLVDALASDESDAGVQSAAHEAHAEATAAGEPAVMAALEARDRVEYVLLGAERLIGAAPALSLDQQIFLVELDHLVRPLLPRLTAFNELRGEMAAAVAPALRHRFWWWCEGAAIAPAAASNLAAVAELVASFPDAQVRFDALVGAAKAVRAGAVGHVAARPAAVTRLSEWIARRRDAVRDPRGGDLRAAELRVAAASSAERIEVVSTNAYDVSWRVPSSVIVDVHVEPRAGAVPLVRLPSGRTLPASLVPRTVHRYSINLDFAALAEDGLVVVIPLEGGDVEVAVPPAE